jgi:hypothetical protein
VRLPRLALAAAAVVLVTAGAASSQPPVPRPELTGFRVENGNGPFAGDRPLLTTISPNGDGFRDRARIDFRLRDEATVTMTVLMTRDRHRASPVLIRRYLLGPGPQTLAWDPILKRRPRTYLVRVGFASGRRTAVVRIQGVDAAFRRQSYRPGALARLSVSTDARSLRVEIVRAGDGSWSAAPLDVVSASRSAPFAVPLRLGDWPSGVYLARLTADDGRVGLATAVLRPRRLGEHRVAVVLPTFTWQAYNFQDVDGDGFGDTWYDRWRKSVQLGRHFVDGGTPPAFWRYDFPFLKWLARRGHAADYLADSDLARVSSGDSLRRLYDLIVFPGHHEYVTAHEYRVVERYRDLGGHLMFLSADNFDWRVRRRGRRMIRVARFRKTGHPEAALVGVQYCCSDGGRRRRPWIVEHAERVPWLWDGTGLDDGARLARGGIEIDRTTPASPRGTIVLARLPHVVGRHTGEMTYYETRGGAEVFAAGAFTLAGAAGYPAVDQFLENLWTRLAGP